MLKKRGLKKRVTAALMAALMAVTTVGLTACGQGNDGGQTAGTGEESTVVESDNTAQESADAGDQQPSTANKGADDGTVRESLTALEVAELMGNGINLGNTMEAYGRGSLGTSADPTKYETCWGQPVTTQEMLDGMKAAGFDTLRLPVAWTNMMDFESGDYTMK